MFSFFDDFLFEFYVNFDGKNLKGRVYPIEALLKFRINWKERWRENIDRTV